MIFGFNKFIAVEPFPYRNIKTEVKNGIAMIEQKIKLQPLKVIAGTLDGTIPTGSVVYLMADQYKNIHAQRIFNMDGKDFILIPVELVQLLEIKE